MVKREGCPSCRPDHQSATSYQGGYCCPFCGWTPPSGEPDRLEHIQQSLTEYAKDLDAHKAAIDKAAAEIAELRTEIDELISDYRGE